MQVEIVQDTLEDVSFRGGTGSCSACQETECLCPVVNAIGGDVLFIKPDPEKMFCTHRLGFGNGHICTCTSRKKRFATKAGF